MVQLQGNCTLADPIAFMSKEMQFVCFKLEHVITKTLSVCWQSPSNIALVKYWGKTGRQLPVNPSISMTLSESYTETRLTVLPRESEGEIQLDFWFEGMPNEAFGKRTAKFLDDVMDMFPWLAQVNLKLETRNTFPHSAGIASSASAFSTLALCLCSLEAELFSVLLSEEEFRGKASYIARLGSGSACRSIFPGFSVWGKTKALKKSTDFMAVQVEEVHPVFLTLHDTIFIVDSQQKAVSSSEGHKRMNEHPFAKGRVLQANAHTSKLLEALKTGDKETFIQIVESEALTLHALMMSSEEGFLLMQPETLAIINGVQRIRVEKKLDICFTLDAGPNVHVLSFGKLDELVGELVVHELVKNNKQGYRIPDHYGLGPIKIG